MSVAGERLGSRCKNPEVDFKQKAYRLEFLLLLFQDKRRKTLYKKPRFCGASNYFIELMISCLVIMWCLPLPRSTSTAWLSLLISFDTSSTDVLAFTIG